MVPEITGLLGDSKITTASGLGEVHQRTDELGFRIPLPRNRFGVVRGLRDSDSGRGLGSAVMSVHRVRTSVQAGRWRAQPHSVNGPAANEIAFRSRRASSQHHDAQALTRCLKERDQRGVGEVPVWV